MKKFIIIIFMLLFYVTSVNASCLLNEPCALPVTSATAESELNGEMVQMQKQSINFLPDINQQNITIPQSSETYKPAEDNFQRKSAPKTCVFGLCLP